MTQRAHSAPAMASAIMLLERSVSAETSDRPIAEPKAAMIVEMAAESTAPPRIGLHSR